MLSERTLKRVGKLHLTKWMRRPAIAPQQPVAKRFGPPAGQPLNISRSRGEAIQQNSGLEQRWQAQATTPVKAQRQSEAGQFKGVSKPKHGPNGGNTGSQARSNNRNANTKTPPAMLSAEMAKSNRVEQRKGREPTPQNPSRVMPKPTGVQTAPANRQHMQQNRRTPQESSAPLRKQDIGQVKPSNAPTVSRSLKAAEQNMRARVPMTPASLTAAASTQPAQQMRSSAAVSADRVSRSTGSKLAAKPVIDKPRFEKDENALREMARRHISYEIKMLRELSAALQGKGAGPRTMNNALLESFLIHYRNLFDFFYPENKRRLAFDVAATDYVPGRHRWRNSRPKADIKSTVENRERVNCLLAHLTLRRLKYKNRSWPDKKMASAIEEMIEAFVQALPQARRSWFDSVTAKREFPVEAQQSKRKVA
jgi:hypothetical protein